MASILSKTLNLPALPLGLRLASAVVAVVLLAALNLAVTRPVPSPARAVWPEVGKAVVSEAPTLVASGRIPMPEDTPAAHASSLLALPATSKSALLAFWFAGEGESAPDVGIASSQFDRAKQQWSPAQWVVNRHDAAEQLGFGLRRIGNPVAWLDARGNVHLFVVATGLGGWAAGRIVHLRQKDPGANPPAPGAGAADSGVSPSRPGASAASADVDPPMLAFDAIRTLPLSWLWNTSDLVRTSPLPLADGGMLLPVYFELGIKYPLGLRFDARGEFVGMTRISSRRDLLQPTLLMKSDTEWLALMRDKGPARKVAVAATADGGRHWNDQPNLALDNTDSSIAGLALAPGAMFVAHNSSIGSRSVLDLSRSADGSHWRPVTNLARGGNADEFSYPALAWADDSLWVSYTDRRQAIAWQRFAFPGSR